MGFHYVDPAVFDTASWGHLRKDLVMKNPLAAGCAAKTCAKALGLKVAAENVALEENESQTSRETLVLDPAASAGCSVVTLSPGKIESPGNIDRLSRLAPAGRKRSIQVAVENHVSTFCESPEPVRRLLRSIPDLKLTFDPSHALMQGQNLESWSSLFLYVRHVHFRDSARDNMQARMGEGGLKADELVKSLRHCSHSGSVSIEYLEPSHSGVHEYDTDPEILKAKVRLETAIGQLGRKPCG